MEDLNTNNIFVSYEIPTGHGVLARHNLGDGKWSVRSFVRPTGGTPGEPCTLEDLAISSPLFEIVVSDPRTARTWADKFQKIAEALENAEDGSYEKK